MNRYVITTKRQTFKIHAAWELVSLADIKSGLIPTDARIESVPASMSSERSSFASYAGAKAALDNGRRMNK